MKTSITAVLRNSQNEVQVYKLPENMQSYLTHRKGF
jgi:hypothetical protein